MQPGEAKTIVAVYYVLLAAFVFWTALAPMPTNVPRFSLRSMLIAGTVAVLVMAVVSMVTR